METDVQHFFDELHERPQVLGLILFGSYARGDHRPDSDIDLLVIISHGETRRKIAVRAGKTYEMVWVTESAALEYWEGDGDGCYGLWSDAQVIFDKNGTAERLRAGAMRIIKKGKAELSDLELAHRRFDVEDQLRAVHWLAREDVPAANHALQQIVSRLVTSYFDMERLWEPPPKKALQRIRKTDPPLGELLDSFYSPQPTFERSFRLAEEISQEVFGH